MTQFEQLVNQLKNLQSRKIQQITLDVKWLMAALNVMPVDVNSPGQEPTPSKKSLALDGGSFSDE